MRNAQILRSILTGAAVLAFTGSVAFGQSECSKGAPEGAVAQINSKEGPPTEKIKKSKLDYEALMEAGMPVMQIHVGKKTTTCMETAYKLAKKLDTFTLIRAGSTYAPVSSWWSSSFRLRWASFLVPWTVCHFRRRLPSGPLGRSRRIAQLLSPRLRMCPVIFLSTL